MSATTSLSDALSALVTAARDAGIDAGAALTEGEALAASVAGTQVGAYLDWCAQTGRPASAERFSSAETVGRRYRVAQTPSMAALTASGSSHSGAYADALSAVALAGADLGAATPEAVGRATTATAAQLGPISVPSSTRTPTPAPSAPGPTPMPREPVPGVLQAWLGDVMSKLGENGARIADLRDTGPLDLAGPDPRQGTTTDQPPPPVAAAPPPADAPPADPKPAEPPPPQKSVEELEAELDELVGLAEVKAEIHRQAAVLRVEGLRKTAGLTSPTITRHLIFNGNPGTGKTTVARLVAGIYRALGLLTKGQLVEVDRSELVAGFLGQTAMKTSEVIKSALGGVLFIDEAYSLAGDQYGQEAIDTLVKAMEDNRGDLVVIVAGYPLPMAVFISQNPGLASRFRTEIDFPNYTDDELVEIFEVMCRDSEYDADRSVQDRLRALLQAVPRDDSFGNARYVRNLLEAAIGQHAWRLRDLTAPTLEQLRTLLPEDLGPLPSEGPQEAVDWQPADPSPASPPDGAAAEPDSVPPAAVPPAAVPPEPPPVMAPSDPPPVAEEAP